MLARAYDAHSAAVLAHFASAEKRGQLLDLDFTAPDAGRKLCDFVLADGAACAQYTELPNIEPEELDAEWNQKHGGDTLMDSLLEAVQAAGPADGEFTCTARHTCAARA